MNGQRRPTIPSTIATQHREKPKEVNTTMTVQVLDRPRTGEPCRENDPELWFAESPRDVEEAKALCLSCPARELCLAAALARQEPWGVWGGQLLLRGVVIPRKRPRGRPRKTPVAA